MIKSPYKPLYGFESVGSIGELGVCINIASSFPLDLENKSLKSKAYEAADLIKEEITALIKANDPNEKHRAAEERRAILSVFPEHIYVEEIPNGYCNQACCRHLPWFIVTTKVGHFEIGNRKRVISIDWKKPKAPRVLRSCFPRKMSQKERRASTPGRSRMPGDMWQR